MNVFTKLKKRAQVNLNSPLFPVISLWKSFHKLPDQFLPNANPT